MRSARRIPAGERGSWTPVGYSRRFTYRRQLQPSRGCRRKGLGRSGGRQAASKPSVRSNCAGSEVSYECEAEKGKTLLQKKATEWSRAYITIILLFRHCYNNWNFVVFVDLGQSLQGHQSFIIVV